ncbi:hypothetical protein CVT26_013189 [Gymnopilus dilepis]|uniref:Uncharacterized protein n=1 Tax=Gymnopilus dilepis TaxID=231916 RepID=A0A409VWD6_9AGAR|nr:hypothetical protein CVT26_013189 [Gymnopilus dilepis]
MKSGSAPRRKAEYEIEKSTRVNVTAIEQSDYWQGNATISEVIGAQPTIKDGITAAARRAESGDSRQGNREKR